MLVRCGEQGLGLSFQERILHTYILRLGYSRNSILYKKKNNNSIHLTFHLNKGINELIHLTSHVIRDFNEVINVYL